MSSIDLRVFLVINNLRQQDLADLLGVTRQTVSNWCRGCFKIPKNVADFCKDYKSDTCNER